MDKFYFIVLSIATVILILILVILGVLMSYTKNNKLIYPPSYSTCPDYWENKADNTCNIPSNINKPTGTYENTTSTPGFTTGNIDFKSGAWNTLYSSTKKECALKKWSNKYNVEWDGISNYNDC